MKSPQYTRLARTTFADAAVKRMSADELVVWIYLLANEHGHMCGLYRLPRLYMQNDLRHWLTTDQVNVAFDGLCAAGLVKYHEDCEVVWVVRMAEYQVDGGKQAANVRRQLDGLRDCPLADEWHARHGHLIEAKQGPSEGPSEGASQGASKGHPKGSRPIPSKTRPSKNISGRGGRSQAESYVDGGR
jgi:hypothetical protein